MKKIAIILILIFTTTVSGCTAAQTPAQLVASTRPVYDFTSYLCQDTGISVTCLVTESLSCLHDYTLQVHQMRAIEGAQAVILSGAGLETFLDDALKHASCVIDASKNIPLLCTSHEDHHTHDGHHHENDPHIWLDANNAKIMAKNICSELSILYPENQEIFLSNYSSLCQEFEALDNYKKEALSPLSCRDLITFHDGFGYFAQYCDLHILHSLEEESGSEASAGELKELIELVNKHSLPAIFTEKNGSTSAAEIISSETDIPSFALNMGMSDDGYFETMYHNIKTVKEALE